MSNDTKLEITPLDIIFSCFVCQATFSEIYSSTDYDKGFRDDDRPDEYQQITKLWLTKCGHLTCSKHLDGGGVPFHPAGDHPEAPCPICAVERNDKKKRQLYAIRGSKEDQHDAVMPQSWFDAPPINLDGKTKDMDALRFHYLSLVRFGTNLLPRLRSSETAANDLKKQISSETSKHEEITSHLENAKCRINELETCEEQLHRWKEREPRIRYYLDLFVQVTKENQKLREQLTAMGYAVPRRTFDPDPNGGIKQSSNHKSPRHDEAVGKNSQRSPQQSGDAFDHLTTPYRQDNCNTASDRTLSGRIETAISAQGQEYDAQNTRKRQRYEQDSAEIRNVDYESLRAQRGESRDLMPPPPIPSKQRSPRLRNGSSVLLELDQHDRQRVDRVPRSSSVRSAVPEYGWVSNAEKRSPSTVPLQRNRNDLNSEYLEAPGSSAHRFEISETQPKPFHQPPRVQVGQSSHEYLMSGALQSPAREHTPSLMNSQRYTGYSEQRQPLLHQQKSNLRANWIPSTPSPLKRITPKVDSQSVISPFFSRSTSKQHTGRITLPPKPSPGRESDVEYSLSRPLTHNLLPTSRTGIAAAPNVIYPETPLSRSKSFPNRKGQPQEVFNPRTTHETQHSVLHPPNTRNVHHSQPPSSPYFLRRSPGEWLSPSMNQIAPPTSPSVRLFGREMPTRDVSIPNATKGVSRFQENRAPLQSSSWHPPTLLSSGRGHDRGDGERVRTSTGLKSGVSRLSNEWVRESREARR